jgi:hypothetical protein
VFCTRTIATYPVSQLEVTLSTAVKLSARGEAVGAVVLVLVGVAALVVGLRVFSGTAECVVALGRAEVAEGVADDGDGDGDGDGDANGSSNVTCGMDGRTTVG